MFIKENTRLLSILQYDFQPNNIFRDCEKMEERDRNSSQEITHKNIYGEWGMITIHPILKIFTPPQNSCAMPQYYHLFVKEK
jgi:hypothetical protein